ncbi:MAG TPA: hypothetical protein VFJ97_08885 [Dermatophilaceae bacterium]|nr:hypothetical protein [Dermatophilaceae bacterium]
MARPAALPGGAAARTLVPHDVEGEGGPLGWRDLAKLGKDWAEAKKDELLTTDSRKRSDATAEADAIQERAKSEAGTSFLERVLPPDLAKVVTDHRPENVAAREAERAARQDQERRADLATRTTALLRLRISGDEQGSVEVALPAQRTEDDPNPRPDPDYPDEPAAMPWLKVVLEAADPVQVGSTTLFVLSLAVPDFRGAPGRYDIADLYERGQAGGIESWDPFDLYLSPDPDAADTIWYWDGTAPASIDVADGTIAFDLPMQSAVSGIRVTGSITWG